MTKRDIALVVVAAGQGQRLGAGKPKAFVDLVGRPLLTHAIESIIALPDLAQLIIAVPDSHLVEAAQIGAELIGDLPIKLVQAAGEATRAGRTLQDLIASAREEVLLQTPYLVLSKPAQHLFRTLHRQPDPPRVVVSTNSLASTDAFIAYAISHKYKRRYLRDFGFEIHEFKPFPEDAPVDYAALMPEGPPLASPGEGGRGGSGGLRGPSGSIGPSSGGSSGTGGGETTRRLQRTESRPSFFSSGAAAEPLPLKRAGVRMGLHAKSMVIDGRIAVIGTHNFDPRSENYNTEAAVVIDDPAFARALADSIRRDMSPQNAWVIAPRAKPPVFSGLDYSLGKVSEALPIFDVWPWRYATSYEFRPGPDCPLPVAPKDPAFHRCYVAVGDFPEVNVGPKWLYTRVLTAFGAGLVPIL